MHFKFIFIAYTSYLIYLHQILEINIECVCNALYNEIKLYLKGRISYMFMVHLKACMLLFMFDAFLALNACGASYIATLKHC